MSSKVQTKMKKASTAVADKPTQKKALAAALR
jgi:hypothetical protein